MPSDERSFWFFLSYARDDRDAYLKKFYEELAATVRRLTGGKIEGSGFFDGEDIELAEEWPQKLTAALRVSRAFVCVQSPTYFNREYCGKEWAIFRLRQDEYLAGKPPGTPRPPLIFPVLWVPADRLPKRLPPVVTDIQYSHDSFGVDYPKNGLRLLRVQKRYRDRYNQFLEDFAGKLVNMVEQHPLPPLRSIPDIKKVISAFLAQEPHAVSDKAMEDLGPRCVEFIFLAGTRQELKGIRDSVEYYGAAGGAQWKPYLPASAQEVGSLAQTITQGERMLYQSLPFHRDLLNRIKDAKSKNRIVILVVDLWTIQLPAYRDFWLEYTKLNPQNCAVLVPRNDKDEELKENHPLLEDEQWKEFRGASLLNDPNSFIFDIRSEADFNTSIMTVLHKTRMKVIEADPMLKRAGGGQISQLPILTGSVARSL